MAEGEYFLLAHVWIENPDGKYLITKRAQHKTFGGMWECPGGCAVAGEESIDTALREVREEVGIALDPAKGKRIHQCTYDAIRAVCDVWHFTHPVTPEMVILQEDEVTDHRLLTPEEIMRLLDSGEFIPVYGYMEWLFNPEEKQLWNS